MTLGQTIILAIRYTALMGRGLWLGGPALIILIGANRAAYDIILTVR